MPQKNNAGLSPQQHESKKAFLARILPESPPPGQSGNHKRLGQAVRQQKSTISQEILEDSQIEGDLALFVLANFRRLGIPDAKSSKIASKMKICPHCQGEYRLNVVSDRRTKNKYLKAGCCDTPLRPCPKPEDLMLGLHIAPHERDYLRQIAKLDWFSGAVAAVLLQIESKVAGARNLNSTKSKLDMGEVIAGFHGDDVLEIIGNTLAAGEVEQ